MSYNSVIICRVLQILFTASIITNALMIPKILQFTTDFHIEVKAKIVGWFLYSLVMLAFLVKSVYNFFLYHKKKQLKEFLVVKESNTLVEFANANNNLVQLVPTPVLSSEANVDDHAGPSGVRPIWKLYYELPKTYFDIHPNSQLP
ncbi:hypothetical protein C0J52_14306 [Blattella germanica]|nr:hypothetical protein C0J52_14306 [Blattella germanica]